MKTKKIRKEDIAKEIEKLKKQRLISITTLEESENLVLLYQFDNKKDVISLRIEIPKAIPVAESIIDIIPGADIYEREAHDLFGIEFIGNPNLHHHHFLDDDHHGKPPMLKEE